MTDETAPPAPVVPLLSVKARAKVRPPAKAKRQRRHAPDAEPSQLFITMPHAIRYSPLWRDLNSRQKDIVLDILSEFTNRPEGRVVEGVKLLQGQALTSAREIEQEYGHHYRAVARVIERGTEAGWWDPSRSVTRDPTAKTLLTLRALNRNSAAPSAQSAPSVTRSAPGVTRSAPEASHDTGTTRHTARPLTPSEKQLVLGATRDTEPAPSVTRKRPEASPISDVLEDQKKSIGARDAHARELALALDGLAYGGIQLDKKSRTFVAKLVKGGMSAEDVIVFAVRGQREGGRYANPMVALAVASRAALTGNTLDTDRVRSEVRRWIRRRPDTPCDTCGVENSRCGCPVCSSCSKKLKWCACPPRPPWGSR